MLGGGGVIRVAYEEPSAWDEGVGRDARPTRGVRCPAEEIDEMRADGVMGMDVEMRLPPPQP